MSYKTFKEKYEYPDLAVLDFLMQKADLFGDERRLVFFRNEDPLYCLTFRNGFKYLSISGRCSLFISKTLKEAKATLALIKKEKYIFLRSENLVFLVIENHSDNQSPKGAIFLDYKNIEDDAENYIPLFYERLIEGLKTFRRDDKPKKPVDANQENNTDYSNKSVSVSSSDISKNNFDLFKKLFDDKNSKCAFILGNGVSIPLGSDSWEKLISNLIDYLSPFYIKNAEGVIKELSKSNYLISSFVRSTFKEKGQESIFIDGLKYCIYRKYNTGMLKADSLLKAIALAKINKPELAVLTYNYDNFLEQEITDCNPALKYKSYSGKNFVKYLTNRIIHLHGTIDSKSHKIDDKLILTDKDYFNAYLSKRNGWAYKAQKYVLSNYNCLFIGSSMSDLFQLSIIEKVYESYGRDWKCFALMCFKNELDDNDKNNLIRFYRSKGIYVIFVNDYDELAPELNKITGNAFSTKKSYSP